MGHAGIYRKLALGALVWSATQVIEPTALADVRTEARRHFRDGMALVVEGRIDEGVAELEVAYSILPHPNVLYNIARAYGEAGRYEEAIEYFDRYLETDPADASEVRGFVAALRERLGAQAMVAGTTSTTGTPGETTAGGSTGTSGASTSAEVAAEVLELRETAAHLIGLADATGSTALRERAARLSTLADNLERRAAASSTAPTEVTETTETSTETGTAESGATPTEGEAITLGNSQTGLYEEQVVSASRYAQNPLDAPNSTTNITRQDIRLSGITQIGELFRRVAGVQVMSTGPSDTNIGIRGFNQPLSPRVLVLLNGRSLYVDPLGVTWYSAIPIGVEDIERIEIIRGPASALYGANGLSGVINIITRDPMDDPSPNTTEASVSAGNANQLRGYLGTAGRRGNLSYRMSTTYSQADRYTLSANPNLIGLHNPVTNEARAYQMATARGHLRYRFNPGTTASVEGGVTYIGQMNIQGTGTLLDLYTSGPLTYAMGQVQSPWGGLRVFWNRLSATADTYGYSPLGNTLLWNTLDAEGTFAREFDTGSVHHNLVMGASYRLKTIEWNQIGADRQENHAAAFFQDALRFTDWFRGVFSIRMDRHPLLDRPVFSPRAALVFRPTEGQAIRLSGSTAFRTQTFLESYINNNVPTPISAVGAFGLGSVPTTALRGIPALRPERIFSAELGYSNAESDIMTVEVSAYYNRVRQLVELRDETNAFTLHDYLTIPEIANFDRGPNRFVYGTAGYQNARDEYDVFGGELGIRLYPVDGLDVYANGSLNYTRATVDGISRREASTPLVQANGGVQYRSNFGLDFAADVHFASETTWREQVATTSGVVKQAFPLPAYYLVNARIGYRPAGLDDRLEFGVVGYNITNAQLRQHPFSQPLGARVLATAAYRF